MYDDVGGPPNAFRSIAGSATRSAATSPQPEYRILTLLQMARPLPSEDIIAAIATPPGIGGIALIRISGSGAIRRADEVFRGAESLRQATSHTVHHGEIIDARGKRIDEVLATVFHAPRSYTGEETVEISCHGGVAVTASVLDRILESGIRHARPGEFTLRAFLNGKMDLAQAEAVGDLIHARSEEARIASQWQLEGRLSAYVGRLRERLLDLLSLLELSLDFTEEDVRMATPVEQERLIRDALHSIDEALKSYAVGHIVREGLAITLTGAPNSGKSSLLNAILGTRRAIVTDIPGTTRDYIEESLPVQGTLLRFIDTAGLRDSDNVIEKEGIEFGKDRVRASDLVCLLLDPVAPSSVREQLEHGLGILRNLAVRGERVVLILNKIDMFPAVPAEIEGLLGGTGIHWFPTSAVTGTGVDALLRWISNQARARSRLSAESGILVTNARHAQSFESARGSLASALRTLSEGLSEEFVTTEIRAACDALGGIIGEVTSEEILQNIFSRFCIGK